MLYRLSRLLLASLVVVACGAGIDSVQAGDKWHVGHVVAEEELTTIDAIDHGIWQDLVSRYVDEQGLVAYASWQADLPDRRRLDAYLGTLSAADPQRDAAHEARLAFWINAYNATTVRGILREYPTKSIRNHTAKLFGYNIWHDLLLRVGGKEYSLDQIEHDILRKLGEPRIHFAIVCASKGCPRLLDEAYTAEQLEKQLDRNATYFFAQPTNFRYDVGRGRMHLSPILDWFANDFGDSKSSRLRTISRYLPTNQARSAACDATPSLAYLSYDWNLNDQPTRGP